MVAGAGMDGDPAVLRRSCQPGMGKIKLKCLLSGVDIKLVFGRDDIPYRRLSLVCLINELAVHVLCISKTISPGISVRNAGFLARGRRGSPFFPV